MHLKLPPSHPRLGRMLYCPSIKDCNLHSKHRQTLLTCLRLPPSHPGAVLPSIMEQEADKWAEINCFNYQASLLPSLLILFIRSTARTEQISLRCMGTRDTRVFYQWHVCMYEKSLHVSRVPAAAGPWARVYIDEANDGKM